MQNLCYLITIALLCFGGCAAQYVLAPDGEYDYRVPVGRGDARAGFETLFVSTVKVVWTPQYAKVFYTHDRRDDRGFLLHLPLRDENSPTGYRLARDGIRETVDSYSKVGTALVVARQSATNQYDIAIALTNAHLVTAPDTIRYFMRDARGLETNVLERISIKISTALHVVNRDGESIHTKIVRLDPRSRPGFAQTQYSQFDEKAIAFFLAAGQDIGSAMGQFCLYRRSSKK